MFTFLNFLSFFLNEEKVDSQKINRSENEEN